MRKRPIVLLGLYGIILVVVAVAAFIAIRDMQIQTRGVIYDVPADTPRVKAPVGVNASLEQYSDADLNRALRLIHDGGFYLVRQHFYWSEIEPRPGEFQWDKWDRLIARGQEYAIHWVAVLDTTPAWARAAADYDLVAAPPARPLDYARFVTAFTQRYSDRVHY